MRISLWMASWLDSNIRSAQALKLYHINMPATGDTSLVKGGIHGQYFPLAAVTNKIAKRKRYRYNRRNRDSPSLILNTINPHLNDKTCEGNEKSSLFWLNQIRKDYKHLSVGNKRKYVYMMISQAHPCLHKGNHEAILVALRLSKQPKLKHEGKKLRCTYEKLNYEFDCTCGIFLPHNAIETNKSQETQDASETNEDHAQSVQCINPYWRDNTCHGGEKSYLFWLDKIRKVFKKLSKREKTLFVSNMISQPHACLHKGYHLAIIKALMDGRDYTTTYRYGVLSLKKIYNKANHEFVCTCGLLLPQENQETHKSPETPDSCEIEENSDIVQDLTYGDIMEALEL
ncbi:unnamed protein product [Meganyctiphanes norvegica]|uniref:Uncharacterized protein n=1 Tax=Meganyctiphanes norvegica TaxID=48144 RepID=A0AAV2PU31_MEGNR